MDKNSSEKLFDYYYALYGCRQDSTVFEEVCIEHVEDELSLGEKKKVLDRLIENFCEKNKVQESMFSTQIRGDLFDYKVVNIGTFAMKLIKISRLTELGKLIETIDNIQALIDFSYRKESYSLDMDIYKDSLLLALSILNDYKESKF